MLSIQQAGYWSKVLSNIYKNGTPISQTLSEALYRNLFIKEDFVNQCFELDGSTNSVISRIYSHWPECPDRISVISIIEVLPPRFPFNTSPPIFGKDS